MTGESTKNNGEVKRRDRHDIVAEMLKSASEPGGKIKTHIMYKAKLSYAQLNEYLPVLVDKGFLEKSTVKRNRQLRDIYKTTPKGTAFCEGIDSANGMFQ